jgi:hypothetical protein
MHPITLHVVRNTSNTVPFIAAGDGYVPQIHVRLGMKMQNIFEKHYSLKTKIQEKNTKSNIYQHKWKTPALNSDKVDVRGLLKETSDLDNIWTCENI